MAGLYADRVMETTTSVGTSSLVLGGAVAGYRDFGSAGLSADQRVRYVIAGGTEWEIGEGTVSSGSLYRVNVFTSSNSNLLVNFSAGTKAIWVDVPADAIADIGTTLAARAGLIPQ
jgi:hypothetical protein